MAKAFDEIVASFSHYYSSSFEPPERRLSFNFKYSYCSWRFEYSLASSLLICDRLYNSSTLKSRSEGFRTSFAGFSYSESFFNRFLEELTRLKSKSLFSFILWILFSPQYELEFGRCGEYYGVLSRFWFLGTNVFIVSNSYFGGR